MSSIVIALVSFATALCLGWILSKAYFRVYTMDRLVPRGKYNKMRERYRKRLMIMHKLVKRHENTQVRIKDMLIEIQDAHRNRAKSAAPGVEQTHGELSGLINQIAKRDQELAELQAEVEPLDPQLDSEFDRASTDENEIQLLKIERDELLAKVARLESKPRSAADQAAAESDAEELAANLRAELGAVRAELSSRERQVKDLERQLSDSDTQRQELRAMLDSWKQRVSPLTAKLKQQRSVIRDLRDKFIETA